jgi:hypothetical protein
MWDVDVRGTSVALFGCFLIWLYHSLLILLAIGVKEI